MKRQLILSALLSVCLCQTVLAQEPAPQSAHTKVFEGTLGKAAIVLEVIDYQDGETGKPLTAARYFYKKYRTSIALSATTKGNDLILAESSLCAEAPCPVSAQFSLKPTALGQAGLGVSGYWQKVAKGAKPIPVDLKYIGDGKIVASYGLSGADDLYYAQDDLSSGIENDPYMARLLIGPTSLGPETRLGAVGWQMATDTQTDIHYPRLSQYPDASRLKRVNDLLDSRRYAMVSWGLQCKGMDPNENPSYGTYGDWDQYESNVTYLTSTIMVISEDGSTYCGGAHPNNSFSYSMFDLVRGEALDITRILNLYQKSGADAEQINTPAYDALLAKLTPKSPYAVYDKSDFAEECLSEDLGYGYSLSFNKDGLVFSLTDLPHVMGACMGDYYVVPYKDLKSLITPEAQLYFPDHFGGKS